MIIQRPEDIDDVGFDEEGNYWEPYWDYKHDYKLERLEK